MARELNHENFEAEVLQEDTLVLVDFWAEWCGPCRSIAPLIDRLAEEYGDKMLVASVNVDDEMLIAEEYRVSSIPTVFIYQDGIIVERLVGAHSYQEYVEAVEKHLSKGTVSSSEG